MVLNRVSDETAADWLSQTHIENYYSRDDGVFLSGGNPYKAFQLI